MPCELSIKVNEYDSGNMCRPAITGQTLDEVFKPGATYYCDHKPTGENWFVLGVNRKRGELCVAGWPATMAQIEDCENWEIAGEITDKELEYRNRRFGTNWE